MHGMPSHGRGRWFDTSIAYQIKSIPAFILPSTLWILAMKDFEGQYGILSEFETIPLLLL
jgi:hypothetical protein